MIIQSSNKPILVVLNDDLSNYIVRANLSRLGKAIKIWNMEDMIFHNEKGKHIIELPLMQEETKEFRTGDFTFEIKWLDSNGFVQFSKQVDIKVVARNDKEIIHEEV